MAVKRGMAVSRLRALREQRVMTQMELAEKAKVPQATISRIEQGHQGAYVGTIRKLAQALGVRPEALIGKEVAR